MYPLESGTPHAGTGETANLLMLGRELHLPDLLTSNPSPLEHQAHHEYTQELVQRLEEAHDMQLHYYQASDVNS